jgi:hypothetical protein
MARKPNYNFERRERERIKAAKKAARQEAKRERSERRKAEAAGLVPPGEESLATAEDASGNASVGAGDESTGQPGGQPGTGEEPNP